MIVISNPAAIANETETIHSFFEEGLELFHVRKPDFSQIEMARFLHQIKLEYRNNLVLHSYHELAEDFGINRIHFPEKSRKSGFVFPAGISNVCRYSTSVHSVDDFNSLEDFEYAFLSPVYKSISKENYFPESDFFKELKLKTNLKTKVVALGGIDPENILKTLENGFDDVALLGTIWNNENPVKQFRLCQKIAHTYSL